MTTLPPKTLYLANPYGFSPHAKEALLTPLVETLHALGAFILEPFSRNHDIDPTSPSWAYQTGQANLQDVRHADAIFAVLNGVPPDEGVMLELGVAIALHKPTFLFRDDSRHCADRADSTYPVNLMAFTGLPQIAWETYYYTSLDALSDPARPLAIWLSS